MNVPTKAELRAEIHELYEMLNASNQTIDDLRKDAEKRDEREDRQWRAGFNAGWNAGVTGDENALAAANSRLDSAMQERQP